MKNKIKEWKINKREKVLASHFFKFLCLPTFGTFAKSHEPTRNQNFAKEPNFTNAPLKSIFAMINWNSYDR
jgi:hypothetical protein